MALTLRLVAGLSPAEVASAFLVSEEAMAKRLVRAKYKIKAANIAYRVPDASDLPRRLRAVLTVLYLIYNAGADDTSRRDLRAEAIWLTRVLVALMPDEPEAAGLLALMLLSDSRMPARSDAAQVVLLQDQDRSLWDSSMIAEGQELVLACLRRRSLGPFQLQAAIQALHCAALRYEETDWAAIVRFYDRLIAVMPTPVVMMNRAIAVAETDGPEASLALLDELQQDLDDYHLLHASRAAMLERLGRPGEAADAYARAAALARTDADLSFLTQRHHLRFEGPGGVWRSEIRAEERLGLVVGWVDQLDPQLVQRHITGRAELGNHRDRPDELLAHAEVRAQYPCAVHGRPLRHTAARFGGQGHQRGQLLVVGPPRRLRLKSAHSCPRDVRPVRDQRPPRPGVGQPHHVALGVLGQEHRGSVVRRGRCPNVGRWRMPDTGRAETASARRPC